VGATKQPLCCRARLRRNLQFCHETPDHQRFSSCAFSFHTVKQSRFCCVLAFGRWCFAWCGRLQTCLAESHELPARPFAMSSANSPAPTGRSWSRCRRKNSLKIKCDQFEKDLSAISDERGRALQRKLRNMRQKLAVVEQCIQEQRDLMKVSVIAP